MKIHKEVLYCGVMLDSHCQSFKTHEPSNQLCSEIIYNCCRLLPSLPTGYEKSTTIPLSGQLHKFCGCNVPRLSLPLCAWSGFRFIRFLGCTWRLWLAWTSASASASCKTHQTKLSNSRIHFQSSPQSLVAMWLLTQRHLWNYTEMCNSWRTTLKSKKLKVLPPLNIMWTTSFYYKDLLWPL